MTGRSRMPARFYYAAKSEGLDPTVIISNLKSAQSYEAFFSSPDKEIKSKFIYLPITEKTKVIRDRKWVEEDVVKERKPEMALFMMGTTAQLTKALKAGSSVGWATFYIPAGSVLHIRYVRRKTKLDTKSVVGIAPLEGYWGLTVRTKDESKAGGFPWIPMYTSGMASSKLPGASITLYDLWTNVLPKGKGKSAQY